jgi:hypothetical protein
MVENNKDSFPLGLLKFSSSEFLKEIIDNETLYFQTIDWFSKKEKEDHQFDGLEGVDTILQPNQILNLKLDNRSFVVKDTGKPIRLYRTDTTHYTHICCFFLLLNQSIQLDNTKRLFDPRMWDFGQSLIFINELQSFLTIVSEELNQNKEIEVWKITPVDYKDQNQITGDWGVFSKPSKLSYQSEYRIAIKIRSNDPIKLKFPGIGKLVCGLVKQSQCKNEVVDGKAFIS